MADLSLDQWKTFLRARLLQESGKDSEALDIIERLVAANPSNAHLQASRAFSLERLKRTEPAVSARLSAAYARAASTLSGDADKPEPWTSALNNLLSEIDGVEKGRSLSGSLVAW